jgi:hypothetical protein
LNCSAEDIAKLIVPSETSDFEHLKKPMKAFNNILPQRILLKSSKGAVQETNYSKKRDEDQNMFEEVSKYDEERFKFVKRQADLF